MRIALAIASIVVAGTGCASRSSSAPAAPAAHPASAGTTQPGWLKTGAGGGPRTGDVFKEIVMRAPHARGYEIVAGSKNVKASDPPYKNLKFKTPKLELAGVKRVEIRMEIWSGHPDTDLRQIAFNDNPWVNLADNPLPSARAADPKGGLGDYMAFIYSTTEIPVAHLKEGVNDFAFECEGGEWELFDWWAITFRLYYDPATPAPKGRIVRPAPGEALLDDARFEIAASSPNGRITRVEYIGAYEDFNYAADGSNEGWQFRTYHGEYQDHVGTAVAPPFAVTWDTRWVPDQPRPMKFLARITDEAGYTTLTPVVDGVVLGRRDRAVKLYRATEIPQDFTAFLETPKGNTFEAITDDLAQAQAAVLRTVTYNGFASKGLFLNDTRIAGKLAPRPYVYDAAVIEVPLSALRAGGNRVRFESVQNTSQHGVDVMYPGAEMKIAFRRVARQ